MGTNNYFKIAARSPGAEAPSARELFFFDDRDSTSRDRAFGEASEALRDYRHPRLSVYREIPGWHRVCDVVGVAPEGPETSR